MSAFAEAEEWYNSAKYLQTAYFSPLEWAEQIKKRLDIQEAFTRSDDVFLNTAMPALVNRPLSPYFQHRDHLVDISVDESGAIVRDLDHSDLAALNAQVEKYKDTLVGIPAATVTELRLRAAAMGISPPPSHAHLVIRLDANNNEIVAAVRAWLTGRRALSPPEVLSNWKEDLVLRADEIERAAGHLTDNQQKEATVLVQLADTYRQAAESIQNGSWGVDLQHGLQGHMEDWHRKKILQYFDLTAWSRWSNKNLTDESISTLLGDGNRSVDLRSIKKIFVEIFSTERLMQLLYLSLS